MLLHRREMGNKAASMKEQLLPQINLIIARDERRSFAAHRRQS